jgi:hypothetical protein
MLIVIVDYTSMARPCTHRSPRSPSHVLLDGHFVFLLRVFHEAAHLRK